MRYTNKYILIKALIFSITLNLSSISFAQLNIPNSDFYNREIERYAYLDSNLSLYNSHLAVRPILDIRTQPDSIFKRPGEYYYWITQKLFKEHFLVFEGKDYWCAVDPIIDLEVGTDLQRDTLERLYWNTRGIRVQAKFFNNFAFETSVYENQAIVPFYQSTFIDNHGEFIPKNNNTVYQQSNGVIPGYSRTKPFGKKGGYDFAFAEGYFNYIPNDWLVIQAGNGNHFIGQGERSLLLSDFSTNYPYFKPTVYAFKGRLQYTMIIAAMQNLYRLPFFSTPEANFERKIGTFNYLEYAFSPNLQVGIFEGAQWRRSDSSGTYPLNYAFLNPIIGTNTLALNSKSEVFNSILGVNFTYHLKSNLIYSQIVLDHSTVSAFQVGYKSYDLFLPKLDVQLEYNQSKPNTYISTNRRLNYSHSNLPIAHPFVSGFKEIMFNLNYEYQSFFISNQLVYAQKTNQDSVNVGTDILQAFSNNTTSGINDNILLNQLEIGYRFNKNYNLQVFFWTFVKAQYI